MNQRFPPHDQRLLIHIFEEIVEQTPERVFAAVPRSSDLRDGLTDITFKQVAQGTDFICQFLRDRLGSAPSYEFETLTYIGIADLRYTMFFLACIKCGYKAFYPSPRNTDEVNSSLMDQTRSTNIFHSHEMSNLAIRLCSVSPIKKIAVEVPSFEDVLRGEAEHIPYNVLFRDGLQHPMLVLHSSGSTGSPKPITMKLGFAAVHGSYHRFRTPPGRTSADFTINNFNGEGGRSFAPFPPFHLGGFIAWILLPIYSLTIPVCPPPLRIPSPELFLDMMKCQDLRAATLPPSIIESLVGLPEGLDGLKKLEWLAFAGGPLSKSVGSVVSRYTMLCQFYGSTETAAMSQLVPLPEYWEYMEFHPDENFRMEHVRDDIYELIFLADPQASESYAGTAAFVYTVGGSEYRSKDLFRKHPCKNLWQFYGRKDDIIVLSSTEKFFPIPTETSLCGDAAITGALVFGEGHARPGVLIEPALAFQQDSELKKRAWLAVQKTNSVAPSFGRISQAMIIFSDPERPFIRTPKGTVIRKPTLKNYHSEIEALYKHEDGSFDGQIGDLALKNISVDDLIGLIRPVVCRTLAEVSVDNDANLYILGLDSLGTADIISCLSDQLGKRDWMTPNLCYTNPNVAALAAAIKEHLNGTYRGKVTDHVSNMRAAISRFSYEPSPTGDGSTKEPVEPSMDQRDELISSVAITGTTGTLGTELVHAFLSAYTECTIACLNRRPDARELWKDLRRSVTEQVVNFGERNLGLNTAQVEAIQSCDVVIHNAWKVDFNQNLSSFEDNLLGLRNLIELCVSASKAPRIVYISSISAAGSSLVVPEAAIKELSTGPNMGYGQSKVVAEHILAKAAVEYRLPVTILRVGQITGSSNPGEIAWPKKEAFPSLFRTSRQLELIPGSLAPINWVPIDYVARIVCELSAYRLKNSVLAGPTYYNLVNPHETEWQELLEPLQQYCGPASKIIPFEEWVKTLRNLDRTDKKQLENLPALKTLEFFEALVEAGDQGAIFETKRAVADSPSLASLGAIDKDLLRGWLGMID